MKPTVLLLTFAEPRDDFYKARLNEVIFDRDKAIEVLGSDFNLIAPEPIRRSLQADEIIASINPSSIHAVILQIPIWTEPTLVMPAVLKLKKPILLLGNDRSYRTSSMVGLFATGGSLDQAGFRHKRLMGNLDDPKIKQQIITFVRAAYARETLCGQRFGLFGGRSLGMVTATADPSQWLREFGVDVIHIDQSMIVFKAETIEQSRVDKHVHWLLSQVGAVETNQTNFTNHHLERQIRSYLAIKDMAADRKLDFIGVKCQEEMANFFCLQCIGQSLLGDPYDADGPKDPIASSCEADMDGALTMQILKLLSDGLSTNLMDLRYYDENSRELWMANCGSMPTSFSRRPGQQDDNLKEVHLMPHIYGEAGGGTTQFVTAAGPGTLARLMRRNGQYWMGMLAGQFVTHPREDLRKTVYNWPHAFFSSQFSYPKFLSLYSSNHIHAVQADVTAALHEFCDLQGLLLEDFGSVSGLNQE